MNRRRRMLIQAKGDVQVRADFGGRVGDRDFDAETRATALYEELRALPTEELARRAGLPADSSRAVLIAAVVRLANLPLHSHEGSCIVRGVKAQDMNQTGGTMDATKPRTALSSDGHPVTILRTYFEDGVEFAVIRYDDGHLPYDVGGRVAGTEDEPLWEHRVKDGEVYQYVPGKGVQYDLPMVVEKGLRPTPDPMGYEAIREAHPEIFEAEQTQPYRPPVETKVMKDSHGNTRTRVRYAGQRHWYRGVANAQIAHSLKKDTYPAPKEDSMDTTKAHRKKLADCTPDELKARIDACGTQPYHFQTAKNARAQLRRITGLDNEGVERFRESGLAWAEYEGTEWMRPPRTFPLNRAATHEGRDELVTEALGVAPGETITLEVDMDRLAGALEKTGHPAAADVRKRANGAKSTKAAKAAEGGTTMTESTLTAESLMEGVGDVLDGVGEAVLNAKGTYYRLRMAGGKTLAYATPRKDGLLLDFAEGAVEKAPAKFQGALVRKGGRATLRATAKNEKLARDLLAWVAPKIDKQG